tara:strand:- start:48769 stop:49482 length:714 start_codon:yes stop_codon:yes gene_type:complete
MEVMEKCGLSINSIYRATEGEGVLVGSPQIFVRFQGCNIGCVNCDSKDTWDFPLESTLSLEEVIDRVYEVGFQGKLKRVSITGGDPLHPKNTPGVLALTKELKSRGYWINIEAAGTRIVPEIFDLVNFISFDYKTPSTHVRTNPKLISKLVEQYQGKYQVKSVVQDSRDFSDVLECRRQLFEDDDVTWVLTPSYIPGEAMPLERFQDVIEWNEREGAPFRVIGQQHKWIHGPDKQQV